MYSGVAGSRSGREGTSKHIYSAERRLCHSGDARGTGAVHKGSPDSGQMLSPQSRHLYDMDTKRSDWASGNPGPLTSEYRSGSETCLSRVMYFRLAKCHTADRK